MGTPAEQLPTPIAADVGLNDLRDLVTRCNDTLETLRLARDEAEFGEAAGETLSRPARGGNGGLFSH